MRLLCGGLLALTLLAGGCAPESRPSAPAASAPAEPAPAGAAAQPAGAAQPAWQAEWERALAGARQEGKVVVLGPPGDAVRRTITDAWRQAYPDITLEWSGGRGGEQATKLEAERRANLYTTDVMINGTTTALAQVRPLGALAPIRPALLLPEVTDTGNWLGNKLEFSDKEELNLVFTTIPNSLIIYNGAQVRHDEIDELQELLDPKWKGKIVVNDPIPSGAGNVTFRWFWEMLGPERATEFFRAMREQAGAVDRDQRRQIEWVARGRYPIVLGPSDGVKGPLREEGMQFEVLGGLKEYGTPTSASFGSLMLLTPAPHPRAAQVFVNWLLSRDGQLAYSLGMEQPGRRLDVPMDHLPADTLLQPDGKYWSSYLEENVGLPPPLAELVRDLYGR
jgi:iron(III) transport system substrate-binding protein